MKSKQRKNNKKLKKKNSKKLSDSGKAQSYFCEMEYNKPFNLFTVETFENLLK